MSTIGSPRSGARNCCATPSLPAALRANRAGDVITLSSPDRSVEILVRAQHRAQGESGVGALQACLREALAQRRIGHELLNGVRSRRRVATREEQAAAPRLDDLAVAADVAG